MKNKIIKNQISDCGNWKIYGSPDPKILIAGHSHTFAMFMAIQTNKKFSEIFGVISHADFKNQKEIDETYWSYVKKITHGRRMCISWNGNQHNLKFLIDNQLEFSAFGYNEAANFPVVSIKRIKSLFDETNAELDKILKYLNNQKNILLLGTPAPKAKGFLDDYLKSNDYFIELEKLEGLNGKKVQTSKDELRAFIWKINQNQLSEIAKKNQLEFLPTPKNSYDNKLILLKEFYSEDLTHANPNFGALMLDEIASFYGIRI